LYVYTLIDYENQIDNLITYKHNIIPSDNLADFCMQKVLSKTESKLFAKQVKSHKKHWKYKYIIMDILGTASYLEGSQGIKYYKKEYKKTNKFLYKHYKYLYDKVLEYFQNRAPNTKVKYRFSYPGFHIFKCNKLFGLPVASIHQDLQYLNIPLKQHEDIDYHNTLSFTLCLELPPTGGGLYKFKNNKKTKVIYKPGYIVCHNGKTTHMIAPSPPTQDNKTHYRITLQGHGLYDIKKNTWWLYW
jgi:hypothetical protein